jgi:hypothetical protein
MIRELIDTDLEVVAGGQFNFTDVDQYVKQTNHADQFAVAFGGTALNVIGSQSNEAANVANVTSANIR